MEDRRLTPNHPEGFVPLSELHRSQRARLIELAVFLMTLLYLAIIRA